MRGGPNDREALYRPTWAEIDLGAVRDNARRLVALAAQKGLRLIAVVKADAYGHGAVRSAPALLEAGVASLAVATPEEGIELRRAGISAQVLVMGAYVPGTAEALVAHDLEPAVTDFDQADALDRETAALGARLRVHVKVDTGLGRLGVLPPDAGELAARVAAARNLELAGIFSHLATAESPETAYARRQLRTFEAVVAELARRGFRPGQRHILNTGGLLQHEPGSSTHARVGLSLYGYAPAEHLRQVLDLQPAMTFRTRVSAVKEVPAGTYVSYGRRYRTAARTRLATLPVGYADGFSRMLTGKVSVLIRGARHPVVGAICMDQAVVDVGDAPVGAGDEVVLLGRQGEHSIRPDEWAAALGTITYEVLCMISARVPRVYVEGTGER